MAEWSTKLIDCRALLTTLAMVDSLTGVSLLQLRHGRRLRDDVIRRDVIAHLLLLGVVGERRLGHVTRHLTRHAARHAALARSWRWTSKYSHMIEVRPTAFPSLLTLTLSLSSRCRWLPPRHAARLAALAGSRGRRSRNLLLHRQSVLR